MVKKFGKKMLLLLTLILAVVVMTVGVATAETASNTIEALALETDSEVVVYTGRTLTGETNTVGIEFSPIVKANVGGAWETIPNTQLSWTSARSWAAPVRSDGVVMAYDNEGGLGVTITGTLIVGKDGNGNPILSDNASHTVSYVVYPSAAIATKADLDALATRDASVVFSTFANNMWYYDRCYALVNDIDYGANGAAWHERYMKPIASRISAFGSDVDGIFGDTNPNPSWSELNYFGARLDGNGFAIKNAIIPLGQAFYKSTIGVVPHHSNWIGTVYGGTIANLTFDNLIFESALDAAANPYMYIVENNSTNLGYLTDANSDGKHDGSVAVPVITENGVVKAIDVEKFVTSNYPGTGIMSANDATVADRSGIVGTMINGTIKGVYVDVSTHGMFGWYNSDGIKAASGILVGSVSANSATTSNLVATESKIKDCVIVPRLTGYAANGTLYNARHIGGLVGYSDNTTDEDMIENCAILLESGSVFTDSFTYNGATYNGINAYANWMHNINNGNVLNTTGLKNFKVYKATTEKTALELFEEDSAETSPKIENIGYYTDIAEVTASVYQGEYGTAPEGDVNYATIIFGQVDLDKIDVSEVDEVGVELYLNGVTYEKKFNDGGDKELTANGRFAMAFYDLPILNAENKYNLSDKYSANVYVKLTNGTVVRSCSVAFTVNQ